VVLVSLGCGGGPTGHRRDVMMRIPGVKRGHESISRASFAEETRGRTNGTSQKKTHDFHAKPRREAEGVDARPRVQSLHSPYR
jgi:hypothetical protein